MDTPDLPSIAAREAAAALVAAEAPCSLHDSEHLRDNVTCVACLARVELEANAPTWLATLLAALAERDDRIEHLRLALSRGWTLKQYEYAQDHDLWAAHVGDGSADD